MAAAESRAVSVDAVRARQLGFRRGWIVGWLLAAAAVTGAVLVAALLVGRAIEPRPAGDLPYPGLGTEWALPVARVLHDLAEATTVGFLLLAVSLLPDRRGLLGPTALVALVRARVAAAVWLVALAFEAVLNLSLSAAQPVRGILTVGLVRQYLTQVLEGQVALGGMIAAAVVVAAPPMRKVNSAAMLLMIAALGVLLPPLLTGHSASASGHDLAMTSLTVHVTAAVGWIGGLIATGWLAWTGREGLEVALPRFSRLAFGCFIAVLISGVVNAAIRLGRLDALWQDRYGLLVLGKVVLLLVLGSFGYRHRRGTVDSAVEGDRGPFLRLAAGEVVVMAATVGLAVALSRSPTPVARSVPDVSPAQAALGYDLPGPVTIGRLLFWGQVQLVFLLLVVLGVVGYAHAVRSASRSGEAWPVRRSLAWYAGLAVVAIATQSGLSRYGGVLMSIHIVQQVLLALVAPALLALGAPVALALRVLPATGRGYRSGRGWVLAALRSPVLRGVTSPVLAPLVLVLGTLALYAGGLFEVLMRQHPGHLLMELFFLAAGCLVTWPLLSSDPLPGRPDRSVRLLVAGIFVAYWLVVGIGLLVDNRVIGADWFGGLGRNWGASPASEQDTAGLVALVGGTFLAVLLFVATAARRLPTGSGDQSAPATTDPAASPDPQPIRS